MSLYPPRHNSMTFSQVVTECERLLTLANYCRPFRLSNGVYDLLTDEGELIIKLDTHEPVARKIPMADLNLSLELYSKTHLQQLVGVAVAQALAEDVKRQAEPGYAGIPQSFGERRAERENRASLRSVRDALVDLLRTIDSGDPDYQNLRVGVIAIRLVDQDGSKCTHWYAGGPDFDMTTGVGLLHRAAFMIQED